ncbi:MAG TPA: phosphoribosylanthranilate isomerase [Balneolales bacterium]|nr:phosphoribosylanthranilate isomerase [Balneolales bacterium]
MIHIKICCIANIEEARLAIASGASAIGLVSEMPSGPGVINEHSIREIAKQTPDSISTFLLTSKQEPDAIIKQHHFCETTTIQLVDSLPTDAYQKLREALPDVELVQVIHVQDERSVEYAVNIASQVDTLLLDSGNPDLKVKELGGTGRTHNWNLSRQIVSSVKKPVFLAGGLKPDNIREAIIKVQPYGLDVCSGVRTNGRLDQQKLENFMKAIP